MTPSIAPLAERNWQPKAEPKTDTVARATSPQSSAAFSRLLGQLGTELDRGERLVGRAAAGGVPSDDAATLIAIQAGIYRYTETVDLAAKLVDATANAARTTLQSGS